MVPQRQILSNKLHLLVCGIGIMGMRSQDIVILLKIVARLHNGGSSFPYFWITAIKPGPVHIISSFRHIFLYSLIMAALVFGLKWMQWKFLVVDNAIEIYVGLIAVFFTLLGIWVSSQLARRKIRTVVIEKAFILDEKALMELDLTSREYEILQLVAKGHSNADIATSLFLSVSTIKTHVSNLLFKLDVKSRTQAVEKAKRLKIIA